MVDYGNARTLEIENVEYPIHILGVEGPAMMMCFWAFMIGIMFNPLFAPFISLTMAFVARKFFEADQKGLPITYAPMFQSLALAVPQIGSIFSTLDSVKIYKGEFRG